MEGTSASSMTELSYGHVMANFGWANPEILQAPLIS